MPWVFGGLAALVVVALIVVAGIFFVRNAAVDTVTSAPDTTQQPLDPAPTEPPTAPPTATGNLAQPENGHVSDPESGLAYDVPNGWAVPKYGDINSTNPLDQHWSSGVDSIAQENYDGKGSNWVGNLYSGPLSLRYAYGSGSTLGNTAKVVFVDFARNYPLEHTTKVIQDKATKIGDQDAWVLEFQLDFSKVTKEKGYKWNKENGAIVLMDRGQGKAPALLYVSVPDTLGTDVVGKVLSSLKPA
jgi:hypothetical protein